MYYDKTKEQSRREMLQLAIPVALAGLGGYTAYKVLPKLALDLAKANQVRALEKNNRINLVNVADLAAKDVHYQIAKKVKELTGLGLM